MKFLKSLPGKLLLGIIAGTIIGLMVPESVMTVIVPVKNIMGQLINFIVPLIVIGFIAPSITKLGSSASRMLGVALALAYVSSVLAALMSAAAGYVSNGSFTLDVRSDHFLYRTTQRRRIEMNQPRKM